MYFTRGIQICRSGTVGSGMPTWVPYTDQVSWIMVSPADAGYLVRDTRSDKTYTAVDLDEVLVVAGEITALHEHMGAGDLVGALTRVLGAKPCKGCERRRDRLNRWLPRVWKR